MEQPTIILCPQCGADNEPGAQSCRMCADHLVGAKPVDRTSAKTPDLLSTITFSINHAVPSICPSCRTANEPIYLFCYKCGGKLDRTTTEASLKTIEADAADQFPIPASSPPSPSQSRAVSPSQIDGRPVEGESSECPKCSQPVVAGSAFCHKCGVRLTGADTVVMASFRAGPRPRLLLIVEGEQTGEEYDLGSETVVGRINGDLTFPHDDHMSGRHARIVKQGSKFLLIDEASRNGTFVRVKKETEIEPGDTILIGRQIFRFEI